MRLSIIKQVKYYLLILVSMACMSGLAKSTEDVSDDIWVNVDGTQYQCKSTFGNNQPNINICLEAKSTFKTNLEVCKKSGLSANQCIRYELDSLKRYKPECLYEVRSVCVSFCVAEGYYYGKCSEMCS